MPHLPCFAAVARHMSFSRAADELALTQAGVSYQIRQLEEKLGFALFVRAKGRQLRLTERASLLLEEYLLVEQRIERTLETFQSSPERRRIRMTAPVDLGSCYLTPRLARLRSRGLHVDLHLSDQVVNLASSTFDFGVRWGQEEPHLHTEPLLETRNVLVCSPAYLRAAGTPRDTTQLCEHDILLRHRERSRSWGLLLARAGRKLDELPRVQVLGGTFALLEGALHGLGIAMLPEYVASRAVAEGGLHQLALEDGEMPATPFFLAYYPSTVNRLWATRIREGLFGAADGPPVQVDALGPRRLP